MSSLLRSTKFVRYFTGAARTLILNSAKTAETTTLINPKALCAANNVLMRDYATKKKESLEPLLQKLDAEVRRFGRITKKDIDEVFDEIKSKNDITSSQSLLVIRCCGELVPEELPEQRTLLVQKIWSVLIERGIPMDISHYNALLRVYIENEHQFSPAKFLEELERKGLQPNRVTYQRLMWRYCQEGDVEGATRVLEKMRELSMPVSEPVLNALVMGHAFHGDTDGAKAVLQTMAGAGLEPSNRTYTLLACGHAKNGDIDGIQEIIKTASEKDTQLTDRDLLEVIEHLAVSGHGDKVEQVIPLLQKGVGYNQDVCNVILRLLNKGQEQIAKTIMKTMPKSTNIEDTPFKGAFFVKQLLKLNKPADEVIKTCKELQEEGLVPKALFIAAEGSLQLGQAELALKLFKELKQEGMEIRQHFYWPLLVQKTKENDEEGLLQILREMSSNDFTVTGEALRDYVIPYLIKKDSPQNVILKLQIANVPTIHAARNLMVELLDSGDIKGAAEIGLQYRPRGNYSLVGRSLINAVNKTKDVESFAKILHVISSKPSSLGEDVAANNEESQSDENSEIHEVGRIVRASVKGLVKPDMVEALLRSVDSKGLRITTEAAESIEQFLGENMTKDLSQLLTKLSTTEMELVPIESTRKPGGPRTTAQMENQLAQLKNKGVNNLSRIQKQLLVAYIKDNNVSKVNSFLEELKQSKFELTTATLAQLFEFYCENDEVERALQCKVQLAEKEPDFVLNKYKLVQMAYALIRANRFDEAVVTLENHKHEDNTSGFMINSKCWQMLNTLAEQKNDAQVKQMTKMLIDNKYIEPSNIILGPSIKVHLLQNDIDGALTEFENCCKQYRSTPWKGELMKSLIMKEDATKLQWLADLSTQIHGEVNILHDLVLAFIECGRLRQARRILETPGLQTRHRRLDDACQRYVEDGKSEYLEGLLEATRELSNVDRSNIFYHLLVTYCKANETDKALGLWTLLQEEGEVPSDQFLTHLGNHLIAKNREVPFVIPQVNTGTPKKSKNEGDVVEKIVSLREPSKPTKSDVSTHIETLTKDGQYSQALDVAMKSIEHGVVPKTGVLKFLLKCLAEEGNVEKIQQLGKYVNDSLKRRVTYDDKLTLAVFNRGAGSQHIDNVLESVKAAKSEEEMDNVLRKYPRSSALATVVQDNELTEKCKQIADIAAAKEKFLPANLLWMELILNGREKEAEEIWSKWLCKAPVVVFRRLLQESHTRKEPEKIEKLIQILKSNKGLSLSSLGNAYSRLINFYIAENKIDIAEEAFSAALKLGLKTEHMNNSTLKRLKTTVEESGRTFKYEF
ncbi:leucine-rich PPR motif-containing protein, mitochondrial [Spodoptera litura]|uniref:Leucine-rich PPR motif-containing protein, mitochondrial n=1 Tax=Spodoptera litura TaxID=69820 RepID=A0A9J7DPR7_SPOLT|nr:leucine-rich PPR motif-containing protein, mitochondrial [Spodoptera litura]